MRQTTFPDIYQAAIIEDWDFVDEHFASVANQDNLLDWSTKKGL